MTNFTREDNAVIPPRLLIFDFHGVIVETNQARFSTAKAIMSKRGATNYSEHDLHCWVNEGVDRIIREINYRVGADVWEEFHDDLYLKYNKFFRIHFTLREVKNILGDAMVGILSNMLNEHLQLIKQTNINSCIDGADFTLTASDVEPKPSPEGIKRALRIFGVSPSDAIMIGNSDADSLSASRACVPYLHCEFNPDVLSTRRERSGVFEQPVDLLTYLETNFGHI